MNTFRCQRCFAGGVIKILQNLAGQSRCAVVAGDLKLVATVTDFHVQTAFQLTQVLVELATQGRQPLIVGGFQAEGNG